MNNVSVKILDESNKEIFKFNAVDNDNFVEMAEREWFEIPSSCRSWACYVCAAKVIKWWEHIDIWKTWLPLVDIEEDQILSCIWWVKTACFSSDEDCEIILKKLF